MIIKEDTEEVVEKITTLSNGLKVVSQEKRNQLYSHATTIGVFSKMGFRLETNEQNGLNRIMEVLTFNNVTNNIQKLAGTCFNRSTRDLTVRIIIIIILKYYYFSTINTYT